MMRKISLLAAVPALAGLAIALTACGGGGSALQPGNGPAAHVSGVSSSHGPVVVAPTPPPISTTYTLGNGGYGYTSYNATITNNTANMVTLTGFTVVFLNDGREVGSQGDNDFTADLPSTGYVLVPGATFSTANQLVDGNLGTITECQIATAQQAS
jgi:hypothetical protein